MNEAAELGCAAELHGTVAVPSTSRSRQPRTLMGVGYPNPTREFATVIPAFVYPSSSSSSDMRMYPGGGTGPSAIRMSSTP